MKRAAVSILLGACACACHRHEDAATTHADPSATASPADSAITASAAPSDTASAAANAVASANASTSADPAAEAARRKTSALQEAQEFGMIGLIGGDPNAPTAPWGREDKLQRDGGARGNMWGDAIGDSFGAGGLGLSGIGDGGGGRGEGIGIGSIGHGAGTGTGQGFGSGSGRLGGARTTSSPRIRQGVTTVNGRLPPEVIQRIVRQNFGRFRLCYQTGLDKDSKLAGMVATKFVIDATGAVSRSDRDASTTLSDAAVVSCVVRAFSNLSFPQPEGGIVTVIYPLNFEPGDAP
jgi:hypothetical protein